MFFIFHSQTNIIGIPFLIVSNFLIKVLVLFFLITFVKNLNMFLINILFAIGPWQVVLVAVVILLLFGGKKIPELMKGLGSGIKEFKKGVKDDDAKKNNSVDEPDKE